MAIGLSAGMKPNITGRQRGGQSWEVERLLGKAVLVGHLWATGAAEGCRAGKTKVKPHKPYHFAEPMGPGC